jgi:HSP20 family protein
MEVRKMLMRFDPFRELDALSQSFAGMQGRGSLMAMDAYRDGDRFMVHLDIPGVDPDSIDLTVNRNVLTVTAERKWEQTDQQDIIVSERRQGRFTRELFLGDTLDADQIKATYDRGVLTLTIPIAEKAKPRRVQVTTGRSGDGKTIEAQIQGESSTKSTSKASSKAGANAS